MALNQQAKRVTVLTGEIDPNYQGAIELILHNEGKEQHVWESRDLLGYLLLLLCSLIKMNGKLQQPIQREC